MLVDRKIGVINILNPQGQGAPLGHLYREASSKVLHQKPPNNIVVSSEC